MPAHYVASMAGLSCMNLHGRGGVWASRRRAGFTLLELIVAVTITAMISGAAILIFTGVTTAQSRIGAQMERHQEARAALHAITQALHNAYQPPTIDGNGSGNGNSGGNVDNNDGRTVLFEGIEQMGEEGPADRLRLFTVSRQPVRRGEPESDVHEVEFFLQPANESRPATLMRRTDPTRNEAPDEGGVVERIAEHVVGLQFSYYDGGEVWEPDWPESRRRLPIAVRVRLVVARADAEPPDPLPVSRIVHFPRRRDVGGDATGTEQDRSQMQGQGQVQGQQGGRP